LLWQRCKYSERNSRSQRTTTWLCFHQQLDRTYVGGIERGERNVALVNLEKIAYALRISLSELMRRSLIS